MKTSEVKLIAYLLSDGGISRGGENGYYLYLRNKDKALLDNFSEILKSFGLKPYKRFYRRAYEVRIGNKRLAQKLLLLCGNFRTLQYPDGKYPAIKIPKEILEDLELSKEFIRIFASCEGYVKFNKGKWITRRITIGCKHPQLRGYIRTVLDNLGIVSKENKTEVLIYGKENMEKFSSIGFVKGSKVQKGRHKGKEREKLLREVLDSYSLASSQAKRP